MSEQRSKMSRHKGFYIKQLAVDYIKQLAVDSEPTKTKGIKKEAKECARDARERKKMYIRQIETELIQSRQRVALLEEENRQLEEENRQLEGENRQLQQALKLGKHVDKQNNIESLGFEGLMSEFQRLHSSLKANNHGEVSRSLSCLRDKYGISGRERFKAIDCILNRLVGVVMPMHYRLLMENASKNKQFYSLLGPRHNQQGLAKFSEFEREVLLKVRPQISRQKQEYDKILAQLSEVRDKIKKQNTECQNIVDEIEDKLSPTYVAGILIDLDCSRSESGLDQAYPLSHWADLKAGLLSDQRPLQSDFDMQLKYVSDQQIFNSLFN